MAFLCTKLSFFSGLNRLFANNRRNPIGFSLFGENTCPALLTDQQGKECARLLTKGVAAVSIPTLGPANLWCLLVRHLRYSPTNYLIHSPTDYANRHCTCLTVGRPLAQYEKSILNSLAPKERSQLAMSEGHGENARRAWLIL